MDPHTIPPGAETAHPAPRLTPRERYARDLASGEFTADDAQSAAVDALQRVYDDLVATPPKRRFGFSRSTWPRVGGLYLWGGVGRGKTYLMDAFFESLPFSRKRRTHFHRFMLEVHELRNRYPDERDPLLRVAADIAEAVRVLCFDEFFVSDIADAMILGRLFEALFKHGVTLIATSNVAPDGLYRDGLQREQFLPAIEMLKRNTTVLNVDGGVDYRLRTLHGVPLYLWPSNEATEAQLDQLFTRIAPHGRCTPQVLTVNGRAIEARCVTDGGAWFEFGALCDGPRSAADYIELGRTFHCILVTRVPQLRSDSEDAARRFITLVDEFYDRGVKLLLGAAVAPEDLYAGTRLRFEIQRTLSRLTEMQSAEYLSKPHLA